MKSRIKKHVPEYSYIVSGGMGRLCQYSKTVEVSAPSEEEAAWRAMGLIRKEITAQDFGSDDSHPFLSKVVNISSVDRK